jgi:hypothetical protein
MARSVAAPLPGQIQVFHQPEAGWVVRGGPTVPEADLALVRFALAQARPYIADAGPLTLAAALAYYDYDVTTFYLALQRAEMAPPPARREPRARPMMFQAAYSPRQADAAYLWSEGVPGRWDRHLFHRYLSRSVSSPGSYYEAAIDQPSLLEQMERRGYARHAFELRIRYRGQADPRFAHQAAAA